jgi:hypothetical protein
MGMQSYLGSPSQMEPSSKEISTSAVLEEIPYLLAGGVLREWTSRLWVEPPRRKQLRMGAKFCILVPFERYQRPTDLHHSGKRWKIHSKNSLVSW